MLATFQYFATGENLQTPDLPCTTVTVSQINYSTNSPLQCNQRKSPEGQGYVQ